ncbi:tryptophan synthase subunit alpha [Buchnera aphidicola]|uniref:Tryptophan synthase alpha chain n=1 Tax=Buchnera aphidicola (Sarucallis kahawaluokalani) TaxID=1241878 RepID=A0A4D6YLX7_9GAMM|nr:tryptophan synthase subunit alpha [Buchnera aphidicola]QCI25985.1 tryptophan synthase subunit alpha [Buchnera aphidicola (Sarucallis kahawaluokalani)]
MYRYNKMFQSIKLINEGCLMPFVTIGDPSIQTFYKIIDILVSAGINALELGIPFSDPLADGVIVQNANNRVLSQNITIKKCFTILKNIRQKYPTLPIGILVYANIIFNMGIEKFYEKCYKIDIDSVLIPDVPLEESNIFRKYAQKYNISEILICPPNANIAFIKKISKISTGFIYLIARSGVTGFIHQKNNPSIQIIKQIKQKTSTPILQGFGISTASQIKNSLLLGTNGVICGSIIINLIQKFQHNPEIMLKQIKNLTLKLKAATKMSIP